MAAHSKARDRRHHLKPPQQFKFVANESSSRKRPLRQPSRPSSPARPSQGNEPHTSIQASSQRRTEPETELADQHTSIPHVQTLIAPGHESNYINDLSEMNLNFPADLEFENLGPWSWCPTPGLCSTPGWSEQVNAGGDIDIALSNHRNPSATAESESVYNFSHFCGSHDSAESILGTAGDSVFELAWLDDSAGAQCLSSPPSTVSASIPPPLDGIVLYEGLFEKFGGLLDKCTLLQTRASPAMAEKLGQMIKNIASCL
ncbi:hypothetical protein H2202_004872 [Exophiala xenobiotica]|nr:hypothetical protein H2202_004872 [Exophiala xenobiotica]